MQPIHDENTPAGTDTSVGAFDEFPAELDCWSIDDVADIVAPRSQAETTAQWL